MRHDWILDVLADLHAYATANDLPDLALKIEEALHLAGRAIEGAENPSDPAEIEACTLAFRAGRRAH